MKSIWDADTPSAVLARAEKGLQAWELGIVGRDEPDAAQLRDAYAHLRLAMREAGQERYAEIIYYGDMSALLSGEVSGWDKRLSSAREAFEAATNRNDRLVHLLAVVLDDAVGLKMAPKAADQKLWEDAHRHTDTSYGIAMLANFGMKAYSGQWRSQYDAFARRITSQVVANVQSLTDPDDEDQLLRANVLAVEYIADAIAQEPQVASLAAPLYQALALVPLNAWANLTSAPDESGRTPEQHQDHAEAQAELTRSARAPASSGCLGCGMALAIGFAGVAAALTGATATVAAAM